MSLDGACERSVERECRRSAPPTGNAVAASFAEARRRACLNASGFLSPAIAGANIGTCRSGDTVTRPGSAHKPGALSRLASGRGLPPAPDAVANRGSLIGHTPRP